MAKNRAFTEYHASQIEMLKLLEIEFILDKPSFSVSNTIVSTILGDKTVFRYIKEELEGIRNLISNEKFPKDIKELSTALGMIFNSLGRISICRMYASDYAIYKKELENMEFIKSYFGGNFTKIINDMVGFLDKETQIKIGNLNYLVLEEQIKKSGL
ncbi:hypothetical protein PTI45_00224 [Paenibacillus nuruki]|uniref:Uncharacterized protein n=2 Tax=Paenibacillus nuruki TaxID=1886670 RepID=A0A1E3L957_9BACL|nr:hypothetical protein PTI45_00224 [Paenibacillus nuruki]